MKISENQIQYLEDRLMVQFDQVVSLLDREPRFNRRYLEGMKTTLWKAATELAKGNPFPALRALPQQPRDPGLGGWSVCFQGRLGYLYSGEVK